MINNDFHPVDQGLEATDDHWGTQMAGDVVTMPRTWSQDMGANIGDMKNSVRTGSDRTNVTPIKRPSK